MTQETAEGRDQLAHKHGLLWQAYTRPSSLSPVLVQGVRVHCGLPTIPGSQIPSPDVLAREMNRTWEAMAKEYGWRHVALQRSFTPKRRASGRAMGQLVWHWSGGAGDAVRLGNFWNEGDRQASSHFGVDEHGIAWYLHPLWSAWHVPQHNAWTIGADVCAPPLLSQQKQAERRGVFVGLTDDKKYLALDPRIAAVAGELRRILDICCPSGDPLVSPTTHRWLTPQSRPTELLPWEPVLKENHAIDDVRPR
jgi:hypothetical protein